MAFITQYMTGDRRVQLGRESFIRKFNWGTNWTKIRVGLRWAINDNYYTSVYNTAFAVGVSVGDTYGYDSPFITDWVGQQYGSAWGNVTLTRTTSSGQPCYSIGGDICARKVGPVVTTTTNNGANSGFLPTVQSGILTGHLTTITKVRTGYLFNLHLYSTNATTSRYDLVATCESDATTGFSNLADNTVPYAAGEHPFDTLNIRWSLCVPTLEIADIMVTRHY